MRVTPDRQTVILAGEPLPRRSGAGGAVVPARNSPSSQRVTIISARVDAVVTESDYTPSASDTHVLSYDAAATRDTHSDSALLATIARSSSALISRGYSTFASSSRGGAFGGASAYARTQNLSERHPIIDTYA